MTPADLPVRNITDGAGKESAISSVAGLASLRAGARLQGTLRYLIPTVGIVTEQSPNEE